MTPSGGPGRRRPEGRARGLVAAALAVLIAGAIAPAPLALAAEAVVALKDSHPVTGVEAFGPAARDQTLALEVAFALRDRPALDKLLADQQDPRSSRYHRWLTRGEFAARFGPAEADFSAVAEWLTAQGFRVVSAERGNRYIRFSASVAQVQRTFGGTIVTSDDGRLHANTTDPLIPARFAGVITRIEGLDNLHASSPMIRRFPASGSTPDAVTDPETPLGDQPDTLFDNEPIFGPGDFYTFYDEAPEVSAGDNGSGYSCIAVIEDSNFLDSAVASFSTQFGLSAPSVSRVFADGADPGINGDETEALLDVEWAHAVAPGAPIKVYLGNLYNSSTSGPIIDAIQRAVSDGSCAAVSVSFGMCGAQASFYQSVDSTFAQAAAQGQSVFISSGDYGAAGDVFDSLTGSCVPGFTPNVSELSADPNVTSVGGTQFTPTYNSSGNDQGWVAESAWDQNGQGATGGGESAVFAKPAYQNGVTPADGMRDVPDVAMIAGPPGVLLYVDGGGSPVPDCCYGGTSLAAPVWAAMQALVGGFQGNLNYVLYGSGPSPGLRDVLTGNNNFNGVNGFAAQAGYDQATGLGTADIAQYVAARLPASGPTPIATATPNPVSSATPSAVPTLWMPTALAPTPTPLGNPQPAPTPGPTPTATATPIPASGGALALSSKTLNFKVVGTDTVRVLSFRIKNSGAGRLSGNVDPSGLAAPLSLTGGTGGFSLAHGQSTTVTVQAAPITAGAFTGTISIRNSDPKHAYALVTVVGNAAPGKIRVPAAVNFGRVIVGVAATRVVTIRNTGPGVLHGIVGAITQPFSVSAGSFTLSQNQSVPVVLLFAPVSTQPASTILTITNDDPPDDVVNIPVIGSGK